jgi:hypothetical protein
MWQALDQSHGDGITHAEKHNGNGRGLAICRYRCARAARDQDVRATPQHLVHRLIGIVTRPNDIEDNVAIFDQTNFVQA